MGQGARSREGVDASGRRVDDEGGSDGRGVVEEVVVMPVGW